MRTQALCLMLLLLLTLLGLATMARSEVTGSKSHREGYDRIRHTSTVRQ